MSLQTQDEYIILELDPQTGTLKLPVEVRQRFLPDWFCALLEKDSTPQQMQEFESQYLREIARQLQEISNNLRIPDEADQGSGVMSITIPG